MAIKPAAVTLGHERDKAVINTKRPAGADIMLSEGGWPRVKVERLAIHENGNPAIASMKLQGSTVGALDERHLVQRFVQRCCRWATSHRKSGKHPYAY